MLRLLYIFQLIFLLGFVSVTAGTEKSNNNTFLDNIDDLIKLHTSIEKRSLYWRCDSSISYYCTIERCKPYQSKIYIIINLETKEYSRCGGNCTTDSILIRPSGIYTNILGEAGSINLKVKNDGSEFVDYATFHMGTYINFGVCKALKVISNVD